MLTRAPATDLAPHRWPPTDLAKKLLIFQILVNKARQELYSSERFCTSAGGQRGWPPGEKSVEIIGKHRDFFGKLLLLIMMKLSRLCRRNCWKVFRSTILLPFCTRKHLWEHFWRLSCLNLSIYESKFALPHLSCQLLD